MSDYTFEELGGTYTLVWNKDNIKAIVDRISNKNDSTTAIVRWFRTDEGELLLHSSRLNFHSASGKKGLASILDKTSEMYEAQPIHSHWSTMIEQLTYKVDEHMMRGEPSVIVGNLDVQEVYPYTFYPFIKKGRPNILFGQGGSSKSYFAILMALMLSNRGYNEMTPVKPFASEYQCGHCPPEVTDCQTLDHDSSVIYLDWESNKFDFDKRVKAVAKGIGLPNPKLRYKSLAKSFKNSIPEIIAEISEHKIKTIIVDSAAKSVGGAFNDAESVQVLFEEIRKLKVENSLIIDHIAKGGVDPIGSVLKINDAGNIWQINKSQEQGANSMTVAFHHRKNNEGMLENPIGMTLSFEVNDFKNTNSVRFKETSVDTDSPSGKDMSTKQKILTLLRNYEPMPVETIVKELGISKEIVAPELSRLKAQNKIEKFVQGDGSSKYGIKA